MGNGIVIRNAEEKDINEIIIKIKKRLIIIILNNFLNLNEVRANAVRMYQDKRNKKVILIVNKFLK